MSVSKDSPLPLHYQIRQILRKDIFIKRLCPGAPFPSEKELMRRFDVSRTTVRKAMDDLVVEGLIYRVQGQGTFVRGRQIERELTALTGFVEDMVALGYRPSAKVVKTDQVAADETVAKKLELVPGEKVTYIERVRLANDIPLSFDTTWLPNDIGQQIVQDDLSIYPIYSLLEDKYGVSLGHADYVIEATTAVDYIAQMLQIDDGSPAFRIERTAYTAEGVPIDYEMLYYRGDRIRFSMRLKRKRPPWRLSMLKDISDDYVEGQS